MAKEKKMVTKLGDSDARVPTGVPGFDELVAGGFPYNSSVLLSGGPGTGKSIFAMQYLVNGATKFGENGLYVSFEQRADALRKQSKQFGWDLESLEKSGKLVLMCIPVRDICDKTLIEIGKAVKKNSIKRLIVDSLSTLVINAPVYSHISELSVKDVMSENTVFSPPIMGDYIISKFLYSFIDDLRELECTSLLISEAGKEFKEGFKDNLGEYACDGVVLISFESLGGNYSRSMTVRKMRATKNNEDVHPVEIGDEGIIVHKIE
jgi:KaiC/GvpD/RAD55 family RecA-like ATPase